MVKHDWEKRGMKTRDMFRGKFVLCIIVFICLSVYADLASAQSCPEDILSNGKFFFKEHRYQDAIATFKALTLLFPESPTSEEALYMVIVSYRELADRQRSTQWLVKGREAVRLYKKRYSNGVFAGEVNTEMKNIETIEAQLTGSGKGKFIALTVTAISSVLLLGLATGL